MPGLSNSRWAARSGLSAPAKRPSSTPSATAGSSLPRLQNTDNGSPSEASPAAELIRFTKIARRMKWKLPFLAIAYRQATARIGPDVDRDQVTEAELMFKLDFFEYYMLCERALVHLQGVFGIAISRDFAKRRLLEASGQQQKNGNGAEGYTSDHRYHANVLEALDQGDNPLHEVLGVGEVRRQFGRAKDLRNRWKNAADGPNERYGKITAPLETYDLERILSTILDGFEAAFVVAERYVEASKQGAMDNQDQMDWGTQEEEWGFMVEAMDWEAI